MANSLFTISWLEVVTAYFSKDVLREEGWMAMNQEFERILISPKSQVRGRGGWVTHSSVENLKSCTLAD